MGCLGEGASRGRLATQTPGGYRRADVSCFLSLSCTCACPATTCVARNYLLWCCLALLASPIAPFGKAEVRGFGRQLS